MTRTKHYDQAYFNRWYRNPRTRVKERGELERKVAMVVAVAEHVIGRRLRSVLDVGCGEGAWQVVLKRMRPAARYLGIDSSEYVVERFGARRHIRHGSVGELGSALEAAGFGASRFDLIVCCDVLNYLPTRELRRGLGHVRTALRGVAYLELFSDGDAMLGDTREWHSRMASANRRLLGRAGFTHCGPHCFVGSARASDVPETERAY